MNGECLLAAVAVENTVYHFDKEFSYVIPNSLSDCVKTGCRVLVPFGKGNRKRQAMVLSIFRGESDGLKEVIKLLDEEPVLTNEMIKMVHFMKEHYFCTLYDAVKAMLPAGINYRVEMLYGISDGFNELEYDFESEEEKRIFTYLNARKLLQKESKILKDFGLSENTVLEKMVSKGILQKQAQTFRSLKDATMKMVRVNEEADPQDFKLSEKQQHVYETVSIAGEASVKEICYYTGVTQSVVDGLAKKGLVLYYEDEYFRTAKPAEDINIPYRQFSLTDEQKKAYDELSEKYMSQKGCVSLLYGITGSGKTSVFMELIQKVYSDGKNVILMVPEISLTPQMIKLFKSRFKDDVAVFHSGLSMGERMDEFKRVKKGLAKIAIGTRSAVFAPFEKIGLIIIDEEQEHTYKSESTPRFHARELAKFRCVQNNCLLLLSSATPSVESFYMAKENRYSLSTLKHRYGKAVLPYVIIADMNIEMQQGNTTGFSSALLEGIENNLNDGKQSILLINRRGHNTFVTCKNCREALTCPHCSISLTYHSANNRLMCHYCGYSIPFDDKCPECGAKGLRLCGLGTQKVELELSTYFPNARILRMDADSTMTKNAHEKKLSAFGNGEYDILIGTQMVAKGLNFPNVTLVGVLNADRMLYSDDYRSYENAFSLITQVVGRSGRGEQKGTAIIQTFTPENPIIALAAKQNYDEFYKTEIAIRKAMLYPPFVNICLVGFVGADRTKTQKSAEHFLELLKEIALKKYPNMPLRVLGPSTALVSKVSNKYRYKIIIKCKNGKDFRSMMSELLTSFKKATYGKDVAVYADMHPINF